MKQIGPPGTGKSAAVIAIVWFAHQHGVARRIAVTAYTHRAVINLMGDIGPTTTDMVFGTSSELFKPRWGNDTPMRGTRAKLDLHETWKDTRLLIVDELFTMTGKHFAAIKQQVFLTM
jgi:archaellum biogenesis ATPase FlaH